MEELNILLADDHDIVRTGLRMLLKKEYPNATFTEVCDGDQLIHSLKQHKFQLIIMDVYMPETDSYNLVANILLIDAAAKILVLSQFPETMYASRYLKEGCYGYITKSSGNEEISKAVRTVLMLNKRYISETLMLEYAQTMFSKKRPDNPFELLSNRELEVIQNLLKGNSFTQIAQMMHVHNSTIATHKARAFEKLNITNLIELQNLATLYGLPS